MVVVAFGGVERLCSSLDLLWPTTETSAIGLIFKRREESMLIAKRLTPVATLILLLGTAAYASNVHLKPPNSKPSFTDNGLTLRASAALSGLGGGTS